MNAQEYKEHRERRATFKGTFESEMTLQDHAEAWARENNLKVPEDEESEEYTAMYAKWIDFAFADFKGTVGEGELNG